MVMILTYLIQFLVALFATVSFAIIFHVPRKELLLCGITGSVGWIVYYAIVHHENGLGVVFASVAATFVLTVLARIFAVRRKNPATVYLLTGIFPLVPGAGIYYTAYYIFTKDPNFTGKGLETFEVAGAIVFGIIFGTVIPQKLLNTLFGKKEEGEPKPKDPHNTNFQ